MHFFFLVGVGRKKKMHTEGRRLPVSVVIY